MKKIERVKKQLIKNSVVCGGTILLMATIYWSLSTKQLSLEDQLNKLNQESTSILNESSDSEQRNRSIAEAWQVYQTIPANRLINASNLGDLVSRIRAARSVKETLELRYRMQGLNIRFTPIEDETTFFGIRNFVVNGNTIDLEFTTVTDEMAISFCQSFMQELPGYVSLVSLEVKKQGDITNQVLEQARSREASLPALVSGRAQFKWRSFSELPKTDTQPQGNSFPTPFNP